MLSANQEKVISQNKGELIVGHSPGTPRQIKGNEKRKERRHEKKGGSEKKIRKSGKIENKSACYY